jgi:hypothetical protein
MGIKYGTQELRNRWNYDRGNEYGTQELKRGAVGLFPIHGTVPRNEQSLCNCGSMMKEPSVEYGYSIS